MTTAFLFVKANNRPAAEIEMAVKYVASMMGFFGAKDIEKVIMKVTTNSQIKQKKLLPQGLKKLLK